MQYVAVVSSTGKALMPCHPARARELVTKGRGVRRFDRGLFYVKLLDRADGNVQQIAVGIDPGSKREAFTLKSAKHTFLNIQTETIDWVKDAEKTSTTLRRSRRGRKTPYRECCPLRSRNKLFLPPSTKARWQWKLRVCRWVNRYYPIHTFIVEDVKATTHKGENSPWNQHFSPLQVGKEWFYYELSRIAPVETVQGFETAQERKRLSLQKSKNKLSDTFEAHCVDSWTIANMKTGGHTQPDHKAIHYLIPLRFHRRQLHLLQPAQGNLRKRYGGTLSMGFKRGSWVKHPKYGVCYVGGTSNGRISLHTLDTGKRLCQNAKPEDLTFLCTASWRIRKGNAVSSAA